MMTNVDTQSPTGKTRSKLTRSLLIVGTAALVTLAAYGFWRLRGLEAQVTGLHESLAATQEQAQQETLRADNAEAEARRQAQRAERAQTRAAGEAEEREAAENARLAAESEADFAQQRADVAERQAEASRMEAERIRAERDRQLNQLQEALGRVVDTRRTAIGMVMNLGEDTINFAYDKADLAGEDREILSRIAGVLMTASGFKIEVYGHTDDVGSQDYNLELSRRRAAAVADYLVSAGVAREIMTVKGFGKSKPMVEGTTDAARALNRRVELGVIDTVVNYTTEAEVEQR